MRRSLLILLALLVVTWLEFKFYPGHSYLQGETQLLVPMLERLDTPGFLSRDLVAANPTFAYTVYDEITQLLHSAAHLSFEQALLQQQLFFRFFAVAGVFLWARALKVRAPAAVLLSAAVNAIPQLTAPAVYVTSPEATPTAFALSLVFFAVGLLMNSHPLPAAFVAGVALLYDPVTAAAFWTVVIVISIADRSLRRLLRPAWPILIVFSLILGNLVQLQAGMGSDQEITKRFSAAMQQLTQFRTPWIWVSNWASTEIWSYLFLTAAALWAIACLWNRTDRLMRWMAIGMMFSGLLSAAAAVILLDKRAQFATEMPLARNLAFSVAMTVLVCGAACWHAVHERRWLHSIPWVSIVLASLLNAQVLDLLHLKWSVSRPQQSNPDVNDLAAWAERTTWGSSMFQFPDLEKQNAPGVFRSLSRRALWADWQSGVIADYSERAGQEWWSRWKSGMLDGYSTGRLQAMLASPVDYYVLRRLNALEGVKTTYSNATFLVYDAQDLRESRLPLKSAAGENVQP